MPNTARTFRDRAGECFKLADKASSEAMRLHWQRSAAHYERLAEIAERLEHDEPAEPDNPLFVGEAQK